MYVSVEEEYVGLALIPAAVRRKHVAFVPEVDVRGEPRLLDGRIVFEGGGLDEHGVGEHVHVAVEEEIFVGIQVAPVVALDDLAVLALHRRSAGEYRHAVARVVVKYVCAQYVLLLVAQLHDRAPELGEVLVNQIVQPFAGQLGLSLQQAHVAPAFDYAAVEIPHGAVADKVGPVMQEGGAHGLAHKPFRGLLLLQRLGADEAHEGILLPGAVLGRKEKRRRNQKQSGKYQSSSLTFCAHPSRVKSQSPNRGSMTMYVLLSFSSRKSSMASVCFCCVTSESSSV